MSIDDVLLETEEHMIKTLDVLHHDFSKVRTGRANPSMLEGVKVDYYGVPTPISQVGNIAVPEPSQLVVKPYDKNMVKEVEKSILAANLGVTPSNEGDLLRITIPKLTEETRKKLVKDVKKLAENAKVAVRNIRRDANDKIKKLEKASKISEDESTMYQDDVQELTDTYVKKIDDALALKEKDLLAI
jgi:ribosome recycling factor